jgi:hypothetical protein
MSTAALPSRTSARMQAAGIPDVVLQVGLLGCMAFQRFVACMALVERLSCPL